MKKTTNLNLLTSLLAGSILSVSTASAQNAYFVDGYHGGVFGHYPEWQTQFMVDQLDKHPGWKINLEIEPETWDSVKVNRPKAYSAFREALSKPGFAERIDIVNPSYGQAYLYNISGESIIRQFEFGIRKMRRHFPGFTYTTYSSEEPCFTSALPQILKSFGFKYAVLKNPNTCWGGYTRAFGGELVNWQGPDGTLIKTVPRYESEAFEENSTWQTQAWGNGVSYIKAALTQGIKHPVGMCLQDAGWKGGPWLGVDKPTYRPSYYVTWTQYFEDVALSEAEQIWDFSQEDVQVSLVWGSQVLQRLAQQVRTAENNITMAEKLAAWAKAYTGTPWMRGDFEKAWRNLMLAQHHDCWIVPYNRVEGKKTWADKVADWTGITNRISRNVFNEVLREAPLARDQSYLVNVFNSQGIVREEIVKLDISDLPEGNWEVVAGNGQRVPSQLSAINGNRRLLFRAHARPLGTTTFRLEKTAKPGAPGPMAGEMDNGHIQIRTDHYQVEIDPSKGGVITSLKALKSGGAELIDTSSNRAFNELRGYFYEQGKFLSSTDSPAELTILADGPLMTVVSVKGHIGKHPFKQLMRFYRSERKIDFEVTIDWQGSPGIGQYSQTDDYEAEDREKAFYNDKYKLLVHFPLNLQKGRIYKNAPFDVTRSELESTFFTRWDSIKNNIVLNWVDLMDEENNRGVALFSDHTTSYAYAEDHPLALNIQYSGRALWGRDYRLEGPSSVKYALVPHEGKWDQAGIWMESVAWNEPLLARISAGENKALAGSPLADRSLLRLEDKGWEITAVQFVEDDLLIRLFNAEGSEESSGIFIDGDFEGAKLVALNGAEIKSLKVSGSKQKRISLAMPQFGIRTIKIENYHEN